MRKLGYVYIMANMRPTLYVGVTSDLLKRVTEHKEHLNKSSFTSRYNLHKLVYYEIIDSIEQAIVREKQIKDMNRSEKLQLIQEFNASFEDRYYQILK